MKNSNRIILPLLFVLTILMSLNLIHFKASAATGYEIEANNSYATANTLAAGDAICGTINQQGDNDYYEITSPSNGKISLNFMHSYSDFNYYKYWEIWIYQYTNGDYNELSYKKIYSSDNENISLPYIGAIKNGVYYIRVYGSNGEIVGENYKIATTFTNSEYYERENNNSYSAANDITLDKNYNGNINKSGDNDYYKIVTTSNGRVSLNFLHTCSDFNYYKYWEIWIYQYTNGNYNELSYKKIYSSDNENISLPYIGAIKNGVYYIRVYGSNGEIVGENYKISTSFDSSEYYEKEYNDSYYTANTITLGKTYSGNINKSGENDYYKIVPSKNGKVSLNFLHTCSDFNYYKYWEIWIYQYTNGNYNELSYKKIYSSDNENISLPYIGAIKNGVYYIRVYGSNGEIVGENYKISTSFDSSEYYEKEFNDSYYTANTITLGKTYSGNINKSGENDYYKITSTLNGQICLNFQHKQSDFGYYKYWEVWLYQYIDGNYNELSYSKIYTSDSAKIALPNVGAVKNGIYYVRVYGSNGDIVGIDYKINASVYLATPKIKSVSNTNSGIKTAWEKVSGATGYYVYRKTGSSSWKKIATIKKTNYTDTSAVAGKTYTYTVKAYYGKSVSGFNKTGLSVKRMETPKLTSVASNKSGITIKWGKVTGASGYYIYRKTGNGGWKTIATVKGNSVTSYLDKSAKKGTTYTYSVRAYSGKYVSYYDATGLKIKDKY